MFNVKVNENKKLNNLSMQNCATSGRSKNSILKGTKAFVWNQEIVRTDRPYQDRRYHVPFNLPPNDVNFIGGLGKNKGNPRSKVHPVKPTIIQQINKMRTQNRIDINFTQPLCETNNNVSKRKTSKTYATKPFKEIIQRISFADIISPLPSSPSNISDSSVNAQLAKNNRKVKTVSESDATDKQLMFDGKPLYITQQQIHEKIESILNQFIDKTLDVSEHVSATSTFKDWAQNLRNHHKKSAVLHQENGTRSTNSTVSFTKASKRQKRRYKKQRKHHLRRLTGYMYGPFTKVKDSVETGERNKFGVTFALINRAKKNKIKKKIQSDLLRHIRLSHMGLTQPPDKDESSDNESLQNVKRLALIRTPYFLVPTIKISQVKKKELLRSKYLKKDRLNRINLLLRDRMKRRGSQNKDNIPKSTHIEGVSDNEAKITKKHEYFAQFFQLSTKSKLALKRERDPIKEKYYEVILNKFEMQKKQCEKLAESSNIVSYEDFKNADETNETDHRESLTAKTHSRALSTIDAPNGDNGISTSKILQHLFKRKKNKKLGRLDELVGPLYVDPQINEKLANPRNFKSRVKYYTNLFKSKFGIRNRLQVNCSNYEDEKIGLSREKSYFSRLVTEWDDYYIHELRYRQPIKKFCVKSDVRALRDIIRKNFTMYYSQENLISLNARQLGENHLIDETEIFGKESSKLFTGWTQAAYNEVIVKNNHLESIQKENKQLKADWEMLNEQFDKLNKEILRIESDFDLLLRIQNLYYLLMDAEWRQKNDWIHRDQDNVLLTPLKAIQNYAKKCIRPKIECTAFAVKDYFNAQTIPNLEKMKANPPDSKRLTKCLENLQQTSFVNLIQFNKNAWIYKEIEQLYENYKAELNSYTEARSNEIDMMRSKETLKSKEQQDLGAKGEMLISNILPNVLDNHTKQRFMAVVNVLYSHCVPQQHKDEQLLNNLSPYDKFNFIYQHCMLLLQKLDHIQPNILKKCEKFVRQKREEDLKLSKKAVVQQSRYAVWTKQIHNII